jgi:transaldolase
MATIGSRANPLLELTRLGQSVWLDIIQRSMLGPKGLLSTLIRDDGLRGVTSNPSIFEKAIDGSTDYDDQIRRLALQGRSAREICDALVLDDIARAADHFRPIYDATGGEDGFVSIEVNPGLSRDTSGSIAEARRLWTSLGRPNIMVKIPGTTAGLPAIRKLLREGVNVNITLLFSVERYREVREAFLGALEERIREGEPVHRIASVASFFVSRIDAMIDPTLEGFIREAGPNSALAAELLGAVAIANAQVAYQSWQEAQASERWKRLALKGARPQRLLWASTSTKNPRYSDTKYVDALIAPHTINTMPRETLEAYRDHGKPEVRIEQDLAGARRRIDQLGQLGLDLGEVTRQLEQEGVRKFVEPHQKLLESVEKKRVAAQGQRAG